MIHAGGWHQLAPFFCAQRARLGLKWIGWRVLGFCAGLKWIGQRALRRTADNQIDTRADILFSAAVMTDDTRKELNMEYIDLTPTWEAATRIYIEVLEHGTEEGKQAAREELIRLAQQYDAMTAQEAA